MWYVYLMDNNYQLKKFTGGFARAPYSRYTLSWQMRFDLLARAEWEFEDGTKVRFSDNYLRREQFKKSRVYVDPGKFDVIEDLTNRTRRPFNAWRAPVTEALARIGIEGVKLNWSQKAGCSCPCSPGFILNGDAAPVGGDFWVKLPDAPTVDESKEPRLIFA